MPEQVLDWAHVRSFLATVENGSLSGAARALGLTQPTLGRHIQELETTLGVVLFHRFQKGLEPTEAGRSLVATARDMQAAAISFEHEARGRYAPVVGTLRVAFGGLLAAEVLGMAVGGLRTAMPGVTVEAAALSGQGLPAPREADLVLIGERPPYQDLDMLRLATFPVALYGAETYWASVGGQPSTIDGLRTSDLIGPDRLPESIRPVSAAGIPIHRGDCRVRTDDPSMVLSLLRAGAGFAPLPVALGDDLDGVVRLNLPLRLPSIELWLVVAAVPATDRMRKRLVDGALSAFGESAARLAARTAVLSNDVPSKENGSGVDTEAGQAGR